ncbi:Zinc finger, RAN-binding domain containing 2 [Perkinsus chesapeaki]|uniref:Zinc finger, RAN-binding domain containing 2 n=1 Tax=Perkinsus chesapeaki TaxID=330153 RepID=A0A7J6L2C9_PERCH|nr:Zinc finger, RAN-binding domain containing 2 [Perkinsus chesapeaki]
MIFYDNDVGVFRLIFRTRGSNYASMAPYAAIALGIGLAFLFARENLEPIASQLEHPFALQIYTYIFGFVVVFRTKMAYDRYWEAMTNLSLMVSKWGDAFMQLVAFSNATIEGVDDNTKPVVSEDLHKFQREWARSGRGTRENRKAEVQRLRNSIKSVAEAFSPDGVITRVFGEEQKFFVVGQLTKWEEARLNGKDDVLVVAQWIVELMLSQHVHGRLDVHAAIQSRVFLAPFLACVGVLGHDGLNEISIELEEPYGTDANDLPMKEMQFTFFAKEEMMYHRRVPNRRAVAALNMFLTSQSFVAPSETFPVWFTDDDLVHFDLDDFRYKFRMHPRKDLPLLALDMAWDPRTDIVNVLMALIVDVLGGPPGSRLQRGDIVMTYDAPG